MSHQVNHLEVFLQKKQQSLLFVMNNIPTLSANSV